MSAAPAPPAEERVALLTGDRICLGCGYNLTGQMIVREPHYALLIVRCPECGTVAAVQEYPLLGRWAGRLGVMLAVLWCLLLFGAWIGSGVLMFTFSVGTAEDSSRLYGRHLRILYRDAQSIARTGAGAADRSAPPRNPASAQSLTAGGDFDLWWQGQDPDALLADAGGWMRAANLRAFWLWVPAGSAMFGIGWFWAIALLQLRRRQLLAWTVPIVALAGALTFVSVREWSMPPLRYWDAGFAQIGPPAALLTLAFCTLALTAGLLLGRALSRGMIRALLPPRMRAPLALLWTAEGLDPPRAKKVSGDSSARSSPTRNDRDKGA